MRIEAYNQVAQLYKTSKATKTTNAAAATFKDQLQISQAGRDYQVAKQAVAKASDIREDRVAELKNKINDGTYQVSTNDFAAKLLEKYNALL